MAEVKMRQVRKSFGPVDVIKGVDLDLEHGEFVVFVGPSGCGKSTLLRLVAGLEDITSGELYIGGDRVNDLPPSRRGISMVFQSYALFPHMTVEENMAFGLKLAKRPQAEIDEKVGEAAKILQLDQLLARKPKELSGGQRQRVAIGRSIVRSPRVFLFDEPLSNLDAALRVQMRIEIARLHSELGATMIYVTHDQVEAMTMADKIVVLRAGLVEQVGSPLELYHHPRNVFVAGFIGSPKMNFIETTVRGVNESGVEVALPGGGSIEVPCKRGQVKPADRITFGVRPEHIVEEGGDAKLAGVVQVVERLGGETYAYVKVESGEMVTAQLGGNSRVRVNDQVALGIDAATTYLFGADELALERLDRKAFADPGRAATN